MKEVQVKVPESIYEKDVKLAIAIEAFTRGLVSIGKAAEIAEMPIQELLVELKRRGIAAYPYSDEDALKELNL